MKINRTKILKYIESQYPFIDDTEKLALAESMLNYFRNNIKKSHEKLKKFDRLMRMRNEEDDELNLASEGINNPEAASRKKWPIAINSSEGYYDKMAPDPDSRIPIKPARTPKFSPFLRDLMKGKTTEEREIARSILRNGFLKTALQTGIRRMSKPQEDQDQLAALVRDKLKQGKFHLNLSEDINPRYSKLLRFLLSSNDPKIRNYAKAIYINTMRSPERQRRAADMELKRQGISDLGDIIQNPQKYGIRANNVTGVFDSVNPKKQYSENIKKYKLKKVK